MGLFRFPNRPIYLLVNLFFIIYLCTHIGEIRCGLFVALDDGPVRAYIATKRPQSIVRWANWV